MIHHLTKATRHLIFWSLLSVAIALTAVRLLLIGVNDYKASLEVKIGAALGAPVKLGGLGANMRGVTPELVLKNIDVVPTLTTEEPPIHVREVRWGINLGEYLLHRELLPSSALTLVGAELSIYRDKDGHFGITGLKSRAGQPLWLFQGQYNLLDSRIIWQDQLKDGNAIQFENMSVSVRNDGDRHRLNAITHLPAKYGELLKLSADLQGNTEEPDKLSGSAYLEGKDVHLSNLTAGYLPMNILAGSADFKLWSRWQADTPVEIKGVAELKDAVLAREGHGHLPIKSAAADFNVSFGQNGWRTEVHHFQLYTDDQKSKPWPDAVFSLGYRKSLGSMPESVSGYAQTVDIAEVMQLAGYFMPISTDWTSIGKGADPKGGLNDFSFYAEPGTKQFALAGKFQDLSIKENENIPGATSLQGRIKVSDKTGILDLSGKNVVFSDARLFAKPLSFNNIKGLFEWRENNEGWRISSQRAEFDCPAFTSQSRGSVLIRATPQPPIVDLQTRYSSADVSQLKHYLPTQVMKEKLKQWLNNAFLAGKITNGELLYHGEPNQFPFTDNTGVFEAAFEINNVQLKYHPEWPPINDINGQLIFDKDVIKGKFDRGQTGKVKIKQTGMTIAGIGQDPALHIEGESEGEIVEMLKVLQQSPLASRVGPLLSHTKISGMSKAALDLTVPFTIGQPIKADASAVLEDADLSPNKFKLPLNKINGELKFNEQGVFAKGVKALFLGRPVDIGINTVNAQTAIIIDGNMAVNDLVQQSGTLPENIRVSGESAYTLALKTPSPQAVNSDFQVELRSELEGIELALPGGLTKTKPQKKPFALALNYNEKSASIPVKFNYNNELKAALNYVAKDRKIASGHILIGTGAANLPPNPGLKLEVNRSPLALQDWLVFNPEDKTSNFAGINEIKLHSNSATWNKTRVGEFDLTLKHNPSFWSGEIDSIFAKGVFDIPLDFTSFKPMVLTLDMINLSALRQLTNEAGNATSGLKVLPTLRSNKTLWRSQDLGRLSLETERIASGVKIKQLSIEGPDETLAATGTWEIQNNASVTQLKGNLLMNRADLLFSKLNITKDFTETSGNVNFQLVWNSPPLQLALTNLRGQVEVSLKNGRILSIEPGFGRVLGILALEQWIKRLQLDFSDIFEEGLTYNSIKGNFNVVHGKATTHNLLIDAVPARITIEGDTDLVKQTVDHQVKVVPKSSDAVPIAGTIVGKVANLIGKTITGKDQDGFFFGREYLVKGNWNNASIKPLHENDGILQKTWNNITDFPWVK